MTNVTVQCLLHYVDRTIVIVIISIGLFSIFITLTIFTILLLVTLLGGLVL